MPSGSRPATGTHETSGDEGQIGILMLGLVTIVLTIILAIVGVTSVQLSRIQLLDAADAAALDASDALVEEVVYGEGLRGGVPLTDESVSNAAQAYLSERPRPSRIADWALAGGTGSPDGRRAVVVLTGTATIPVVSPVLSAFGGGVTITVRSTARSDLVP